MRIAIKLPPALRGATVFSKAVRQASVSDQAIAIADAIFEIIRQGLAPSVQQQFFDSYGDGQPAGALPVQPETVLHVDLEIDNLSVVALTGEFLDMSLAGSEWIRDALAQEDAAEAIVFEVICDILEEQLPPSEQQDLLDANLEIAVFQKTA